MLYVRRNGRWEPDPPTGLNGRWWELRWYFFWVALTLSMLVGALIEYN